MVTGTDRPSSPLDRGQGGECPVQQSSEGGMCKHAGLRQQYAKFGAKDQEAELEVFLAVQKLWEEQGSC